MYRFTRSVQAKNAAHVAPAVVFAADICAYVNKTYKVNMQFGVEVFNRARIHWFMEMESIDQSLAMNKALLKDAEYQKKLDEGKSLWLKGSLKDTLVSLPG